MLLLMLLFSTVFSGQAQTAKSPMIPGDREEAGTLLNDYDPERDGYFGYLPVRYYLEPLNIQESEVLQKDIPVIVWKNKIFMTPQDLATITGISFTEKAEKLQFVWGERKLVVTRDSAEASFVLGPVKQPYLQERFFLSVAPFRGTNQFLFVPFTDICAIMGVDLIAQEDGRDGENICYAVNPPQEDVYDLLAAFGDETKQKNYMYMYEADQSALYLAEGSSRTVMTLDGMLNADADYYLYASLNVISTMDYLTQYKPSRYIWNKVVLGRDPQRSDIDKQYWDSILAESLIRELWFASESETVSAAEKAADVMSSELGILFYDDAVAHFLAANSSAAEKVGGLIAQLEQAVSFNKANMSPQVYVKYNSMLTRYKNELNGISTKWSFALNGVSNVMKGVKTCLSAASDLSAFKGRDLVTEEGLKRFLDADHFNYLSSGAALRMKTEYTGYTEAPKMYAFAKAIWDTVTGDAIEAAMGPASLITAGFQLATAMDPVYQKTLDSMVAYQTSLLSIAMQHETYDQAVKRILKDDRKIHTELRDSFLDNEIFAAYLYYRSCAVTRELVQKAFEYEDPLLDALYQKTTLLGTTYGFQKDGRPLSYRERFDAVRDGLDSIIIANAVIPLYVSVDGKVLTFGDDQPVPDAVCLVSEHGRQRVYFTADKKGEYRELYIPVFWPEYGITEFDPDFDINLFFYSKDEEIEGDDSKKIAFKAGEALEVPDAHLLWKGSLEAVVVDKESGERIEEPKFRLEHLTPEIFRAYGIPTEFSGKGDWYGNVIQEELPPGTYKAVFSKEGYESQELEITIQSGQVTKWPEPIELEKKKVWLLVEEDYQDIANRGLWSYHLDYSYDEEGRLIEIGPMRAASNYCYYEYDEDGRKRLMIGGTSGSTWTAEKYTYDTENRLIRADQYTLDYEGVSSREDWKNKTLHENGWKKYYYNGDLLVKIDHYSKDGAFQYGQYYEYDEDGRLLWDIEVDEEGKQLETWLGKRYQTTYEYNEAGQLVKETYVGSRVITTVYEYDEAGQLVKETNLYTEYVSYYSYDEYGNRIEKDTYSKMGKSLASKTLYTYKLFPFEGE
ncbi:MAG: hypothetical protein J5496_04215 [Lachnospiraceae bacterium]|nr:hypothetical protein [Lachnospiraceae bacterium]